MVASNFAANAPEIIIPQAPGNELMVNHSETSLLEIWLNDRTLG